MQNPLLESNTDYNWILDIRIADWQVEQYSHDRRNHSDIICLHKADRLKHYGLHFAKYVGRLARGDTEKTPVKRTVVDCALVSLSAANTLMQRLDTSSIGDSIFSNDLEALVSLAEPTGRFCDACEKIDHFEEFISLAKNANQEVMNWVLVASLTMNIRLPDELNTRRDELAQKQFFIR